MWNGFTDFKKASHGLQASDGTKINAILEGTHGDESACEDALPVLQQSIGCGRHAESGNLLLLLLPREDGAAVSRPEDNREYENAEVIRRTDEGFC
jgi:hypothetical protein